MDPLVQHVWGPLIAAYLFLGGMGGASMLFAHYFNVYRKERGVARGSAAVSLISVILGVLFLIMDLEKPELFYLSVTSLRTSSWIFRGSVLITLFIVFGLLYTAAFFKPFKWLPWAESETGMWVLGWIASILGLGVATYTGILLGVAKAIPFWHSPGLPALFVASALATGIALVAIVNIVEGLRVPEAERARYRDHCTKMAKWGAIATAIELSIVVVYYYIYSYGPNEAAMAVNMMLFGEVSRTFWAYLDLAIVGAAFLLLVFYLRTRYAKGGPIKNIAKSCVLPLLGSVLILVGGFLLRMTILEAGVMTVFLPP